MADTMMYGSAGLEPEQAAGLIHVEAWLPLPIAQWLVAQGPAWMSVTIAAGLLLAADEPTACGRAQAAAADSARRPHEDPLVRMRQSRYASAFVDGGVETLAKRAAAQFAQDREAVLASLGGDLAKLKRLESQWLADQGARVLKG